MKKILMALLMLTCMSVQNTNAQWTDITDYYFTNARFNDGWSGWTRTNQGGTARLECAEYWNETFDIYQTFTLPAGRYRATVQAYFRPFEPAADSYQEYLNGNDAEHLTAVFYVGDTEVALPSVFTVSREDEYVSNASFWNDFTNTLLNQFDGLYYSNTMESARALFDDGEYLNEIEFTLTEETSVSIGLRSSNNYGSSWSVFDNFTLEYFGTPTIPVKSITLSKTSLGLSVGETHQLTAIVFPSEATNSDVTWSSSNPAAATVTSDGFVTAKAEGSTRITVSSVSNPDVSAVCDVVVYADEYEWVDVTEAYVVNPNFDGNSSAGWTFEGSGQQVQYNCMECYQQGFDIYQEFNDVPNGRYRISVQAYYRTGENSEQRMRNAKNGNDPVQCVLYANETTQPLVNLYSIESTTSFGGDWSYRDRETGERYYYPNSMQGASVAFERDLYWQSLEVYVEDNHLRFGIKNPSYVYYGWSIWDSFKLEYYGEIVEPEGITLDRNDLALVIGETAQLTATVKPKNATFRKVYWESDDESVAKVDENGLVTAQTTPGTAHIYAMTYDYNYEAECEVRVTAPDASADQYVINEIMSGNAEQFLDPTYNFGGWIELYNPTDKAAPLGGFYLSDDATNLQKWHMPATMGVVPAHGYKVIWFDNNGPKHTTQATFKLDCDGGTIYLSNIEGKLLVSQEYGEVITRMSYARTTDAGRTWMFTAEPTPEASNNNATYCDEQLERPYVDKDGQLFTGTLNISVEIPDGATLMYTTDGTLPELDNGEVSETGFFSIAETTVFRFRLFQDGYLPSEVATRSYIYEDRPYTLPIISIVTDPKMLYDSMIGCYTSGSNGIPGRGSSSPRNWNQEWERPVNFEYMVDGQDVLNQEVTFNTAGGWSRGWAPSSFKLKGNKKFGTSVSNDPVVSHEKTLNYPFFKDKPYIRNRTLQNRNAGNDVESGKPGRMKDAVLQRIALTSGIDLDGQSAEPILYFINGQVATYPGFGHNNHPEGYVNLNMREPNNKHYVYSNYGWDDEEIDIWEMDVDSGYVQMCGDRTAFEELYDLSANSADPVTYERIRELLDIEEFQNFMAVAFYLGSTDWPHNNTKSFRNRQNGRFRYILYDVDWAFNSTSDAFTRFENNYYKKTYGFYPLFDVYDENGRKIDKYYKEVEFVAIFIDLLQNEEFRKQFIDRFCIVGGSVYEPNRVAEIINDFAERKKDMLVYDGLPNSMNYAQELINNLTGREPHMSSALKNYWRMYLGDTDMQAVKLSVSDPAGTLYINDIEVPQDYFNGHLFAPVTLRAEAPAGYRFKGWMDKSGNVSNVKTIFDFSDNWDYYDQGSLDDTGWQYVDYDENDWKGGVAPFGFGNSGKPMSQAATWLDYGPDSGNKRFTYYMRKEFTLNEEPKDGDVFSLNYQVDDGALIWVNGQEAASFHVPSGSTYDYYTNATNNWYVGDDPATGTFVIDNSLLHKGTNLIAVEVHNCNNYSSDLWWDASLVVSHSSEGEGAIVSTDETFEMPLGESLDLMAVFENKTAAERAAEGIAPIRINEISATNSIYVDDYYKKSDWVELYNTTDEDIDIAGMYMTDKEDKPTKWLVSKGNSQASTIVPAHGFLLVWCDSKVPVRQLHANFKLAAEGGIVRIQSADGSWSDMLRYPAHNGDQTVGRYPNGADSVYVMTVPTIEKSNIKNSYMTWTSQDAPIPTGVNDVYVSSNGGLRIFFTGTQLGLRSEETASADVTIYTMDGRRVFQTSVRFESEAATVGLSPIMPGHTYVARAIDNEGNQCSVKFLYK
ncbi:MAG: Ig-like domain-containing protein [Bacteroidales bacterium]|nr:Ig-like domain-containing protein [Bacteroidales bacterium]